MKPRRERNLVYKKYKPGMIKVALIYPSYYTVAANTLAYQMLYYYLNSFKEFYVERIVMPDDPADLPVSLESGMPLSWFDIAFISVHYEPDFANIMSIIDKGGVAPRAAERDKPVIIAGGPPIISNPAPIEEVLDVAVVGEIESTLPLLVEKFLENFPHKKVFLESLSGKDGFYVPQRGREEVVMKYAVPLLRRFHPVRQFYTPEMEYRFMVETNRGCFRMCTFCMEGHIFSYMRERPLGDVLDIIGEGVRVNDTRKVTFISLSFFDYSHSEELLENVKKMGLEASIPSLRADTLNEYRLRLIRDVGQKTVTIAPETGSRELAAKLHKYVPLEKALKLAGTARALGFKSLKLYFMVGIPGESDEHLRDTINYIGKLAETGFKGSSLKVTVSPLVPKPHTAFEREAWVGLKEARRRIKIIKRELAGLAEVRPYDPRWAQIQTVISRGGRELWRLLLEWGRLGGGLGSWRRAVRESGISVEKYLREIDGEVPWSHIVLPGRPRILRA